MFNLNELEFNDFFLEAEIYIEQFNTNIEISVEAQSLSDMSNTQKGAIDQFEMWDEILYAEMEGPIFRYYKDSFETTDIDEPIIEFEKDIWNYIKVGSIFIPKDKGGDSFVIFSCGCDWETEHGLSVCVKNGSEIIFVGPYDDCAHLRDGKEGAKTLMYSNFVT